MLSSPTLLVAALGIVLGSELAAANEFVLQLRSQSPKSSGGSSFVRTTRNVTWKADETAVIVCDVWDYHHCLNAVRRLEEFAPRMDDVLKEARRRGATIIHSPSDCMEAYSTHPARKRAAAAPVAQNRPRDVEFWCSRIPAEEKAVYPIDQSDGGEDDDPVEHAQWAAKLKTLGRNPGMPWKAQSSMIEIDSDKDFISDRGDEVWNILESRKVQNVILVGVHTNMCVLGRPFGLRQMARNGKHVVLMRDMTDCMYNPRRWPYVNHFTGNDLIVSHVERFVCPTVTSDQILGGRPFRSKFDMRPTHDVASLEGQTLADRVTFEKQWSLTTLPATWESATAGVLRDHQGTAWYRCAIRLPKSWMGTDELTLSWPDKNVRIRAWFNGNELRGVAGTGNAQTFATPSASVIADDANLLVVRVEHSGGDPLKAAPALVSGKRQLSLKGRWQFRLGDDASWSNIPLPARFGASTDILFEP